VAGASSTQESLRPSPAQVKPTEDGIDDECQQRCSAVGVGGSIWSEARVVLDARVAYNRSKGY